MRELLWRCFGHKIDMKRLFYLGALIVVSGIVFQMLIYSFLGNKWLLSPPESFSSYESFNSTTQSNEFLKEAELQQVHPKLPSSLVLLNSSNKLIQSVPVEPERVAPHQRNKPLSGRRNDTRVADTTKTTPRPPHQSVPSHLQVEVNETLNF